MSGRTTPWWLALGLAVTGGGLGVLLYVPLQQIGAPPWAPDLYGGSLTGLAIGLALRLFFRIRWMEILALAVVWAAVGTLGGMLIRSLYDAIAIVTAWTYGLAFIGALRGAAAAFMLARYFERIGLSPAMPIVVVGWILGTVIPILVISRTVYWSSPTLLSHLFWGILEAAVGSGVMLWQVNRLSRS